MFAIHLLAVYGICFGLQNKLPFLYSEGYRATQEPETFMDKLLHCTYCTGVHAGWLVWVLMWGAFGTNPMHALWGLDPSVEGQVAGLILWCFAMGAWCYLCDVVARWCEARV